MGRPRKIVETVTGNNANDETIKLLELIVGRFEQPYTDVNQWSNCVEHKEAAQLLRKLKENG